MKIWKITGALLMCLLLIALAACGGSSPATSSTQSATVERGNLTVTVTGSGNVKAFREVNLTFGSVGKVARMLVKEGDRVAKGDPLAVLDTSALELAQSQARVSVTQAEVALTQAKLSEQTAAYNLKKTRDSKESLELAFLQAQINTSTANYSVKTAQETYKWPDIEATQSDVDDAKALVQYAVDGLQNATTASNQLIWENLLARAQVQLDAAEAKLKAQFAGFDREEIAIKQQQLQAAKMAEVQAGKNLDDLAEDIRIKELQLTAAQDSVTQSGYALTLAQQSLGQAQKQLREATITAPFTGVVAQISAREEEMVTAVTTVIRLVDTSTLELVVELDEIDIPGVVIGQDAVVSIDALPRTDFKGKVALIYPLPNEVGGIVLYNVKINLDVPADSGLKVGMSASADIVTERKENILLVPSRAISEDNAGNTFVRVVSGGQTQQRPVVVGIDDGFQTEIASGLQEGETVVVETKASSQESLGLF